MEKELNFFEKSGADDADNNDADNETKPLEIDETGRVLTPEEVKEEEKRRREDPNWWREQK
ncbi:MAG: hypothetical protein AAB820_00480 [Patescibacteria group bacterium]